MPDLPDVNAKSGEQTVVVETPSADQTARDNITRAFGLKEKEPVQSETPVETAGETQTGETEQTTATEQQTQEQTIPPEQQASEQAEPELDQATRTWLGRKIAEQTEKKINPLLEKIASLEAELGKARTGEQPPVTPQEQQPAFDPDEPVYTKGEVLQLVQKSKQMEQTAQQRYVRAYVDTLSTLANEDNLSPDIREEVSKQLDEVMKNPISDRNPLAAATKNYTKALRTVLLARQTTPKEPKVPVGGEAPISATGLSTGTQTESARPATITIDAKTKKMMNSFNLKDDWVQKKLQENR
jgi:hypothetical protein